ncbi:glutamine--fructose-6-phosphate transaminase (isomerizing) [Agaribacterium haliotis]|uniref:glutamine--fructose-6-phosphate transaminase (isomerizing) n=1 Tax=Agaribacterium haliotis TaxID=2013869 RepID=UPI000BB591BE|nr:glutamine--fructose-6-phosphate transaminase (isomerizing) [Agaribacterium haliotis]
MCGIVGGVAQRDVAEILIEGLRRLEYRGYDSAGLAVVHDGEITRLRRLGKVKALAEAAEQCDTSGGTGIAHTRWATHGEPSEANAHPHMSGEKIALVHNGIIENHSALRRQLQSEGYHFSSDTDTEVIAHLVDLELKNSDSLLEATQKAVSQLEGAYGTVVFDKDNADKIVVARSGSPLVIGLGIGENFVASDQLALLPVTRRFIFLEEGDVAEISRRDVKIFDEHGKQVKRDIHESDVHYDAGDKGPYRHYMLKEIHEQPQSINDTLEGRLNDQGVVLQSFGSNAESLLKEVKNIQIVACGTSYHSGLVARYWIEAMCGLPCQVEIASEFRYRQTVVPEDSLLITISQSGETADTLAALRKAKAEGFLASLAICNVAGSSLVRESDMAFLTRAGTEIGVASTKAFTTQLVALAMLVSAVSQVKGSGDCSHLRRDLEHLPALIEQNLKLADSIEALAEEFADKHHALFLGRGDQYPIAMEGALKLKEISYIHAEAYAAGELKHGPLALIDADMPIIVVAPNNELLEKLKSNVEEVRARGGVLYVFADEDAEFESDDTMRVITVPSMNNWLSPIVYTLPLQLLSYYVAIIKGTDVDQPRNLAKSVTVE